MKKNAKFGNTVKIEGYVFSTGSNFNQLSERTAGDKAKHPGQKYIAGDLEIATDEAGLNVVTIHYSYVTPTYSSGSVNKTYTALKQIIDNPKATWLESGKENAIKVQCTGVSIGVNDFIGSDGSKVAALRNENGFCTIVSTLSENEADRSTFSVDMLITKVSHIDEDPDKNIKQDYTTVSGCIFGFGPKIVPATFNVRNPSGMKYFEDLDANPASPVFTKVWGKVTSATEKVERTEESAFGEAAVRVYERKNKEYLITGTAKIPYDFGEEEVLTAEDVKKMSQDRQILLAEVEERFKESQTAKASNGDSFQAMIGQNIPEGSFIF
jgi:hypothetical protein